LNKHSPAEQFLLNSKCADEVSIGANSQREKE
jgi:hypothetical protein